MHSQFKYSVKKNEELMTTSSNIEYIIKSMLLCRPFAIIFRLEEHDCGFMTILKAAYTRWLSHDRSTKSIFSEMGRLINFFSASSTDSQCAVILSHLLTYAFQATLALYRDVLPELAIVSRSLQDTKCDYSVVRNEILKLQQFIRKQIDSPGGFVQMIPERIIKIEKEFKVNYVPVNRITVPRQLKQLKSKRKKKQTRVSTLAQTMNQSDFSDSDEADKSSMF